MFHVGNVFCLIHSNSQELQYIYQILDCVPRVHGCSKVQWCLLLNFSCLYLYHIQHGWLILMYALYTTFDSKTCWHIEKLQIHTVSCISTFLEDCQQQSKSMFIIILKYLVIIISIEAQWLHSVTKIIDLTWLKQAVHSRTSVDKCIFPACFRWVGISNKSEFNTAKMSYLPCSDMQWI